MFRDIDIAKLNKSIFFLYRYYFEQYSTFVLKLNNNVVTMNKTFVFKILNFCQNANDSIDDIRLNKIDSDEIFTFYYNSIYIDFKILLKSISHFLTRIAEVKVILKEMSLQ